ncbi:MAG TPA: hypothetical protein VH120_00395 [Gemmataceae bacterium]|jgi:hypothetical protein|nr:hypothetical protein [Gemmataceae bacterium]
MSRVKWAVLVAVLTAGPAAAQAPKNAQIVYTNRPSFSLPVRIDDRDRADLRELKFYAKALQGSRPNEWVCLETAAPTKAKFGYRAPQDGEYWFNFVTVDKAGRIYPSDLDRVPPGLVVVVDTKAPDVEVQRLPSSSGEMFLQCNVRDTNPDYATVKLEYRGIDRAWHAMEPVADSQGVFRIPDKSVLRGVVRATAADKAGNQTVRELDMTRDVPTNAVTMASAKPPAPPPPPLAAPTLPTAPIMPPMPPPTPTRLAEKPLSLPTLPTEPPAQDKPQLLNGVHCLLEYALDMPNASKVEGFATKDGGQTWQRLGEDSEHKSPFEFELPGDGTYGLVLVVATSSHPAQPPAAGDAPDWWVEIDTGKPTVMMGDVRLGSGDEAGQLVLRWSAEDKNLGPDPVSLFWASSAGGPWTLGATGMKASGTARWAVPKDAGTKFYLKLEATDQAGNVGKWESKEPILMGPEKARIRIIGVSVKR